jgi:hypothetical protein
MARIWRLLAAALLGLPMLATWSVGGRAADLVQPAGQVVLTVAGAIGATNRGPYDEFEDAFFKHHERKFDKAAAFDLAMLEGLGMHAVDVRYSGWPRAAHFEGPWLKDVLAAAGASGHDIAVLALDGFATEISAADLAAYDWIVAVKRDGRYLDIGQRGPTWIVYARRDGKAFGAEDEQRWPWAAFLIEVK